MEKQVKTVLTGLHGSFHRGKRIIYKTLYHREKAEAFSLAAQEAKEVFSRCPICGHLVCDDCFMLCEEIEMCRDCAERLNERGTPVGR